MSFSHISVLLRETIDYMQIKPDGIYVDGTAGGGGHSAEIAKLLTTGRLIATDVDPAAVKAATERLAPYGDRAIVVHSSYSDIDLVLEELGIDGIDGMTMDLGVSSHQLDTLERGFSYHGDNPLDMRMSGEGTTAADVVNTYSFEELCRILRENADEKFAPRIAKAIIAAREKEEIKTTKQFSEIVNNSLPAAARRSGNPSKTVFQAIRIEVNHEFDHIKEGIEKGFEALRSGGRLCIITFHSIEDRIVKNAFRKLTEGCTCPKDFPVCVCGKTPRGKIITKKALAPTDEEVTENKRSRSARLRVIEKL